jgi:hypothetical protein
VELAPHAPARVRRPLSVFDEHARIASKLDGAGFYAWVFARVGAPAGLSFERWKEVAAHQADGDLRGTYGAIALVFAELTPGLVNWQQALEGWNVRESIFVDAMKREGMLEGEVKAHRADVLEVIQTRLANPVPESVRLAVEGTNDPEILRRWLRIASTSESVGAFAAAIASPEGAI